MPFSTRGLIGQEFTVSEVYGSARYQYLYRFVENPGALGEFFGVPEEFLAIADAVDVEFDSRFDAMII
ncbi:MAG: hypothetical protein IJV14_10855 [Lachnospiraceae bacterium]|nr:hypothetical protein [Lachnospiraceae bacterium]